MAINAKPEAQQPDPVDVMMEHVKPLKMPKNAQDMQDAPEDNEANEHGEKGQQQSLERGEAIEAGPVRDQDHAQQSESAPQHGEQRQERGQSSNPMLDDMDTDAYENPRVENQDLYGSQRQGGYGNDRVEHMELDEDSKAPESQEGDRVINGVNLDAPTDETGFADDPKNSKAPKKLSGNES
jgi:hypothetical protein